MNFNTWFNELQTRTALNGGAGLVAFGQLLARLDNPQNPYQIIHVAGTNGKGTVCTLLARVLAAAGEKAGLFVSPHLILPTERIQLDSVEITPDDFINAVEKVLAHAQEPLNFFELITAAALVYFAEKEVSHVVLETGLGGRKDPTNVCMPVLSIITSIGLDHTQLLGNTLDQIAAEKAGIIKPGVPVLCGELLPAAARVVEETAREKNAPLEYVCVEKIPGNARAQNIGLVQRAAKMLGIPDDIICRGLKTVQLPGRFEIFKCAGKTIILDGAHNPPAVENLLARWQKTEFAGQRAAVLCGFMQDKDYPHMLRMLSACFKMGVVTAVDSPRAAKFFSSSRRVGVRDIEKFSLGPTIDILPPTWQFVHDVSAALARAQEQADVVLVTGSFYLVGAVRKWLI
ncbi:MAG: bifunctional folylpolyglutamate synthase/dihydrofolate synthase [Elusimicrobiaceae bacterium]|nr:bifunctional folylpolyglutamate synthase/dihydrofolate synthase [Elusimicrobiaceae bacterium]